MEEITFVEGETKDHEDIINFLNEHFLHHEPMNISIGLIGPGYRMPFFDQMVRNHLEMEDTVVVLAKDGQEKMMGLTVFIIESKNDTETSSQEVQYSIDRCPPSKLSTIFTFLDYMKSHINIEKEYKVNTWGDVEFLVCRSDTRVPGLGTELTRRAVEIMEQRGVKVITAHASSHFSGKIFQKVGFQEVFCQAYSDYKVEGGIVFPTSEPHTHARLYVRDLQ